MNLNIKGFLAAIIIATFILVSMNINAQQSKSPWKSNQEIKLLDFENKQVLPYISTFDSEIELVKAGNSITSGKSALKIKIQEDAIRSGIEIKPKESWSTKPLKAFCLVFDATNQSDISTHLVVSVRNGSGKVQNRSSAIPPKSTVTCYFELGGEDFYLDHGMRDDPPAWQTEALQMKIRGRKTHKVDFSEINSIQFAVHLSIKEKVVIIDNVRLLESPDRDPNYLTGIIDKFGQNATMDFPLKVYSEKELENIAKKELKALAVSQAMPDRGRYNGWANGPKLKATGYFRAEKYNGKWALVDPEGYLFFSTGIANVRMANTTSFTGIDYKNEKVRKTDPNDVTPEDSKGIVKLTPQITNTAYKAHPQRRAMFIELPAYDSPLANHYSYRRESHFGPIEHGETFSFYQANLERRYGEAYPGSYLSKWRDVTLDRMLDWGFTSFGNWVAPDFYHSKRMPYFANGWIIGDFKKVSSGNDVWAPMPDPFDPVFAQRARATVETIAEEVLNSPWCIGVFIDNEKSWGREGTVQQQYGIVLNALTNKANNSPLKNHFVKLLKKQYSTISNLNKAWRTSIESWEALAIGLDFRKKKNFSDAMVQDFSMLLEAYATKYFKTVHDLLEELMPNHMYLGCRLTSWGMTPEIRKSAMKYVDVFSYNYYRESLGKKFWSFLEAMDKPSIIGEYHMGALDAGSFHPGLIHATDQKDRARMWKAYTESVIDNPYFVGVHYFQYTDSPITGRAYDGENYNIGFVNNQDIPYPEMVKAAKEVNKNLYNRRFGPDQ